MGRLLALLVVRAAAVAVALPATTRRFFGPQDFVLNATGAPLVVFEDSQQLCEQEQRGLAGSIVVWKPRGALITDLRCSTERLYIHAARAGAVALIIVAPEFERPGRFYYDHDGSAGGLTGGGRMVLLDMAAPDFASLKRATAAPASALVLSPTANPWQVSIDHWATILAFRVLLPAIALTAGARAYSNRLALGENFVGRTAVVLMIEMVTLPVLAVVWILGAYAGSAWLASSVARFFYLGFTGWATLSTLLLAQHWRAQSRLQFGALVSSTTAQVARDPRSVRKQAPWYFALGTVTVGVETYFSAMLASYRMPTGIKLIAAACILVNLCISGYFIAQACRLNTRVLSVLSVRLPGTRAHLRRVAAWLALSGWCTVLYSGGTVLFIAHGEKLFWWHFSLGVCALGRILNSFAQIRSLDPPLDELDEPAPDATYTCGDATYGDDEEKCVGDEAAFQPLQIPIKELLFSIVHGKDVPAAAGDFELSVRDNALDSMMFLHTSPAPALILDEQACVVMWSVGMERVLGAGAPLRHGMPLAELPFSTSVDADHALGVIDDTIHASDTSRSAFTPFAGNSHASGARAVPVPAGNLRMRLRLSTGTIMINFAVSHLGLGADCVVILTGTEVDAALFAGLSGLGQSAEHVPSPPASTISSITMYTSFTQSSDGAKESEEQLTLHSEINRGRFATTFRGTWVGQPNVISVTNTPECAHAAAAVRREFDVLARLPKHEHLPALLFVEERACTSNRPQTPLAQDDEVNLDGAEGLDACEATQATPPPLNVITALVMAPSCVMTLEKLLRTRGRELTWSEPLHRIARGVAAALVQLHSDAPPRVAHGDVRPANVFLRDGSGEPVLGGFGRACVVAPSSPQGGATPPPRHDAPPVRHTAAYYLAPELRGAGAAHDDDEPCATVEADVFAFGCLLARLASPRKPARVVLAGSSNSSETDGSCGSAGLRFPSCACRPLADLARACCAPRAEDRPPMRVVAEHLDRMCNLETLPTRQAAASSEEGPFSLAEPAATCSESEESGGEEWSADEAS